MKYVQLRKVIFYPDLLGTPATAILLTLKYTFQCSILTYRLTKNRDEIKNSHLEGWHWHNYLVLSDDTCAYHRTRFGAESAIGPLRASSPDSSTMYMSPSSHRCRHIGFRACSGDENVGWQRKPNVVPVSLQWLWLSYRSCREEIDGCFFRYQTIKPSGLSSSSQFHTRFFFPSGN